MVARVVVVVVGAGAVTLRCVWTVVLVSVAGGSVTTVVQDVRTSIGVTATSMSIGIRISFFMLLIRECTSRQMYGGAHLPAMGRGNSAPAALFACEMTGNGSVTFGCSLFYAHAIEYPNRTGVSGATTLLVLCISFPPSPRPLPSRTFASAAPVSSPLGGGCCSCCPSPGLPRKRRSALISGS